MRAVTRMTYQAYQEFKGMYDEKYKINLDYLIAGALQTDVGKLMEYEKSRWNDCKILSRQKFTVSVFRSKLSDEK